MNQKSASIFAAVVLILIVIVLLISYSYYPSSEYTTNTPVVDARVAQSAASRARKEHDSDHRTSGADASPDVWNDWMKQRAARDAKAKKTGEESG